MDEGGILIKTTDPAILIARRQKKRENSIAWYWRKKESDPNFKASKAHTWSADKAAETKARTMIAASKTRSAIRQAEHDALVKAREAKQNRLMKLAAKMKRGACK